MGEEAFGCREFLSLPKPYKISPSFPWMVLSSTDNMCKQSCPRKLIDVEGRKRRAECVGGLDVSDNQALWLKIEDGLVSSSL